MRNPLSIILLLLAGMVLLAHDCIPHQHHDDNICFEHAGCLGEHQSEHHSPEDEDSCCLLADLQLFSPANQLHSPHCPCCVHDAQYDDTTAFAILAGKVSSPGIIHPLLARKHPFLVSFRPSVTVRSQGLRAPPVV